VTWNFDRFLIKEFKVRIVRCFLIIAACWLSFCSSPRLPLEDVPETLPVFEVKVNSGDAFDGLIFLKSTKNPGSHLMINQHGEVMWYLLSDTTLFRPFRPVADAFITMQSGTSIYEIEYGGDTLNRWVYNIKDGYKRSLHHDMLKDDDGNLVALTYKYVPIDSTLMDSTRVDGIIKYSSEGVELWNWSMEDLAFFSSQTESNRMREAYMNAINLDLDGNYLLSLKNWNQIIKVDSKTGKLIWNYGERENLKESDWINVQHAVTKKLDGDYMIFDNGKKSSRAFGFNVIENDQFETTMSIELPDSLYSVKEGSVYQFAKDRYLFSSSTSRSLIVTNAAGEILWLATTNGRGFYRAYYLSQDVLDY
jgi:hypothetical protein